MLAMGTRHARTVREPSTPRVLGPGVAPPDYGSGSITWDSVCRAAPATSAILRVISGDRPRFAISMTGPVCGSPVSLIANSLNLARDVPRVKPAGC